MVNSQNDSSSDQLTEDSLSTSSPETSPHASGNSGPWRSTQNRVPSWLKVALLISVIAVGGLSAFMDSWVAKPSRSAVQAETDPEELAKRTTVKDFVLTDATGGKKKLSDFRGNVVILSFWASWCQPCLVELPTFAEIEKKFHEDGLRIVAVNVDDGTEGLTFAKDFWAKKAFSFTSYFDSNKAIAQQFEVDMLPSNFVIDKQGRLVFSSFGSNDWSSPETIEFIEGLLLESEQTPAAEN